MTIKVEFEQTLKPVRLISDCVYERMTAVVRKDQSVVVAIFRNESQAKHWVKALCEYANDPRCVESDYDYVWVSIRGVELTK